jgi:hypothetical protein
MRCALRRISSAQSRKFQHIHDGRAWLENAVYYYAKQILKLARNQSKIHAFHTSNKNQPNKQQPMRTIFLFMLILCQTLAANPTTNASGTFPGDSVRARRSPIPLQAAICDIIGTGFATGVTEIGDDRITRIEVENYWIGNPGSNTLFIVSHTNPPVSDQTPILFFASSYHLPEKRSAWVELHFLMAFHNDEFRLEERRRALPVFYAGDRSWIPCVPENEGMVAFASNLVVAAQISTNKTEYYEFLRDGQNQNFPSSQIWIDAETSFWNSRCWMDTNMMWRAWDDPQLDAGARNAVNSAFKTKNRSFFPRPPQFE